MDTAMQAGNVLGVSRVVGARRTSDGQRIQDKLDVCVLWKTFHSLEGMRWARSIKHLAPEQGEQLREERKLQTAGTVWGC